MSFSKALLALALTLLPALSAAAGLPTLPPTARLSPHLSDPPAWRAHLRSVGQTPLQAACQPFFVPARGERRGTVLLFHGYSACPQQYWELAERLAQAGMAVYAPLLPGHGLPPRLAAGQWHDVSEPLPTAADWERYQTLAGQLAQVMPTDGLRVVVGLSVGGAVAASALAQAPERFDRALLLSTLFDVRAPENLLLPLLGALAPGFATDWGPGCEQERAGGRGGYCQFRLQHLDAIQRFGQSAFATLSQVQVPVQLVGVEADGTANNATQLAAAQRLPQARICFWSKGANHSLLSRHDSPRENKFWLPGLLAQTERWIVQGEFFQTAGASAEGPPLCH